MNLSIHQLAWCTGFPPATLRDFVKRGLLQNADSQKVNEAGFNGLALVKQLEVLRNAR